MILKVRQNHSNAGLKECGWDEHSGDGWEYYEADQIAVVYLPECSFKETANHQNLVFHPMDVFPCHKAYIKEECLFFNTEAYLMNEKGKTVESFPAMLSCNPERCTHDCHIPPAPKVE